VDLEQIDVCPKPGHACVHRIKDMFTAQANPVDHRTVILNALYQGQLSSVMAHSEITFGENGDVLSRNFVRLQSLANDSFTVTMGIKVSLL
jgi:hypothetical protein